MKTYLQNIIPRIQDLSKTLDRNEYFIEKPWVLLDERGNHHQYIFQRKGILVFSVNGKAGKGTWEYIAPSQSLFIDHGTDQLLLSQGFISDGLMVLKKEGVKEDPIVLVNRNVVPDLDPNKYLKGLLAEKLNFQVLPNSNGKQYFYPDPYKEGTVTIGTKIHDEDFQPTTEDIVIENDKVYLVVKQGTVEDKRYVKFYKTEKGELRIDQVTSFDISIGDKALLAGDIPPSGVYKLEGGNESDLSVTVQDGVVVRIKQEISTEIIMGIVVAVLLLAILIYAISKAGD